MDLQLKLKLLQSEQRAADSRRAQKKAKKKSSEMMIRENPVRVNFMCLLHDYMTKPIKANGSRCLINRNIFLLSNSLAF